MLNSAVLLFGVLVVAADDSSGAPELIPPPVVVVDDSSDAPELIPAPPRSSAVDVSETLVHSEPGIPIVYSHPCCGYSSSICQWLFSSGDMPQHTPYYPELHGSYYFRPYHIFDLKHQQAKVLNWGGDPRNPYANKDIFSRVYARLAEENGEEDGEEPSQSETAPKLLPMGALPEPTDPAPADPGPEDQDLGSMVPYRTYISTDR